MKKQLLVAGALTLTGCTDNVVNTIDIPDDQRKYLEDEFALIDRLAPWLETLADAAQEAGTLQTDGERGGKKASEDIRKAMITLRKVRESGSIYLMGPAFDTTIPGTSYVEPVSAGWHNPSSSDSETKLYFDPEYLTMEVAGNQSVASTVIHEIGHIYGDHNGKVNKSLASGEDVFSTAFETRDFAFTSGWLATPLDGVINAFRGAKEFAVNSAEHPDEYIAWNATFDTFKEDVMKSAGLDTETQFPDESNAFDTFGIARENAARTLLDSGVLEDMFKEVVELHESTEMKRELRSERNADGHHSEFGTKRL